MMISEIFHSLQGEGLLIGMPTVFVRTSGCNLRCKWCDTEYAFDEGTEMYVDEIVDQIKEYDCGHVCITGGEPLIQEDSIKLVQKLLDMKFLVSFETGGSISLASLPCSENLTICMDIKCPSSGEDNKMRFSNIELLSPNDQLKFVIADGDDYGYAKKIIAKYRPVSQLIMQPVGGKEMKELADDVLRDRLAVRVLPQLHKLIWGDRRGV
jgi:7-carboxy-7-deazaguanine synthase